MTTQFGFGDKVTKIGDDTVALFLEEDRYHNCIIVYENGEQHICDNKQLTLVLEPYQYLTILQGIYNHVSNYIVLCDDQEKQFLDLIEKAITVLEEESF